MSKRLDMSLLIDINCAEGEYKPVISDHISATEGCKGYKPITVGEAMRRIIEAERYITNLQRGVNGMWKLIDEAHNTTKGE